MAMGPEHRTAIAAGLRRSSEHNRCPVCRRGAAMIIRRIGDRHECYCRWIEGGLCEGGAMADSRVARQQ